MCRCWILQANPAKFRIDEALAVLREDDWEIRQYTRRVHTGDRVFVWRAGAAAGIVAIGVVIEEPEVRPPSLGTEFWVDRANGERLEHRARVRYTRVLDPPLLRRDLRYHPALAGLSILRRALGTVFPVTCDETAVLDELIAGAPAFARPADGVILR